MLLHASLAEHGVCCPGSLAVHGSCSPAPPLLPYLVRWLWTWPSSRPRAAPAAGCQFLRRHRCRPASPLQNWELRVILCSPAQYASTHHLLLWGCCARQAVDLPPASAASCLTHLPFTSSMFRTISSGSSPAFFHMICSHTSSWKFRGSRAISMNSCSNGPHGAAFHLQKAGFARGSARCAREKVACTPSFTDASAVLYPHPSGTCCRCRHLLRSFSDLSLTQCSKVIPLGDISNK